jgi:hypothetical protein
MSCPTGAAREGGHPENQTKSWIPAFAGMTNLSNFRLFQHPAKNGSGCCADPLFYFHKNPFF